MIVVIANDLPPTVRGRLKLWFIEPKPNVFVSGVKDHVASAIISYLYKNCPIESGALIFHDINRSPWYELTSIGCTNKKIINISGLQLIIDKINN